MITTLSALLAARFLGDLVFGLEAGDGRLRPVAAPLRAWGIAAATAIFLGADRLELAVAAAVFGFVHLPLEWGRSLARRQPLRALVLEQALALALTVAAAFFIASATGGAAFGVWSRLLPAEALHWLAAGFILFAGTVASLQLGAALIRHFVAPFSKELGDDIAGLEKGGLYIGCLERAITMLLVLIGQPAGVGFVITAKSILRFGDVKDSTQRKHIEYIIIGTFVSFGWGLAVAVLTRAALLMVRF